MIITVEQKPIELDDEGYLVNLQDWSTVVAEKLAELESITLTEPHWQIINLLRQFYQQYELSPANRPLIKYLSQHLDKEQANSLQLNLLFKGSPAKLAAKLAGLPKPTNCL
ncbi:TusE/DsrC/DsvC family sulfur relay protein [Entomomonas sp. E2T0]|uniref:TusE/DsrC/DsvC family sulfur relay protein n=1 Tax=Entomomonas sp. E2T0 TaxID=2930213 RepID=UPI002228485C|nr:TusE/DsrC/DsvC family sulfur relay protein [Entomomonas sp. E2T0]UYZ85291.1 TusE/DsrC/DsvC family sulfur relay protein [Entomomonas sp. E2T0]